MRTPALLFAALGGTALGLFASLPLAHGDAKPGTIGADEIKEGMKGYGLSVFHGEEPEKFDVDVIGVLHNFRAGQDLIMVKTTHPRLAITRNVQGMSGSPIWIEGRLAGAYAYSLRQFMVEPVAGVTPIAPMLTELHRPMPAGFWPLGGAAPLPAQPTPSTLPQRRADADSGATRWVGAPGFYDAKEHQAQVAARIGVTDGSGVVAVDTPLLVAGLGERSLAMLKTAFEPLGVFPQAGGGGQAPATSSGAQHFVDGGSLGVQLSKGDVSMMGLGTVTHVEGARLCGFGHPMMNAGDSALPTALGRVLMIYASDQHSFKVGEATKSLGALVGDRQSAVVVDETKVAPTIPMHVEVKGVSGAPRTSWNVEVAEERFMSANLAATVLGGVIEATVSDHRDITWAMKTRVKVRGHGPVDLDDFGIAIGGMPEAGEWFQSRVIRVLGDSLNNPWENVHVESVESTITVEYARDLLRLRGVDVLDPVVDAGDKARLLLHLLPFSGVEVQKTVEVTMPRDLAGKDVEVEVVPGYEVAPEVAAPENLDQLLANASRQNLPPKSVVVQFKVPLQGVTYEGHVAPRLPSFALDALRPQSTDRAPESFVSYARTVVPIDQFIEGRDKVKIKVRSVLR